MTKTIKIISLLWVILILLASYTAYNSAQEGKEIIEAIKTALLMIGGLGVVISIVYQAESMLINSKQISQKIEFDKIENSFELLKDWDNSSLLEARKYTRQIKKERQTISDDKLLEKIKEDLDLEHSLVMTFNFWEQVYLSINKDRVDSSILEIAFKDIYLDMHKRFEVWINKFSSESTKTTLNDLQKLWSRS